jgi:type IV pilus assembly protein PilA
MRRKFTPAIWSKSSKIGKYNYESSSRVIPASSPFMKTIKCPQCNLVNFSTAINCKRCGYFFQEVNLEAVESASAAAQGDSFANHSAPGFGSPNAASNQSWTPPNQTGFQNQNYASYRPTFQNSRPKIKLAVISMILGIFSFPMLNILIGAVLAVVLAMIFGTPGVVIGFLLALAFLPTGLITGITALVKANRQPHEYGGKGFAITGIILSGLSILILPVMAAVAVPNLLAARKAANEGSAITSLRALAAAQETFMSSQPLHHCGELVELGQYKLIDSVLSTGTKSGYIFIVAKLPRGCEIHAKPINANGVSATGIRSFYYSTEDGVLRGANKNGQLASKIDEPLDTGESAPRPKIASQR